MDKTKVYDTLKSSKPCVLALFDPDRLSIKNAGEMAKFVCDQGITGILVGSSLLISPHFNEFIAEIKKKVTKPVIIFPGGSHQVSSHADAIFFLSLISGRNPEFLISEQVKAVFLINEYDLEVIPVGYILVASGSYTAVEYVSNTRPIPRNKPEIAAAHALAAQYMGMKYVYLEAGSGATYPVPIDMIKKVRKIINIPLIIGGGIRDINAAKAAVDAGADCIVLGSIIERSKQDFEKIMKSLL
jgi:phosphoglycerol geranylgeranyltransferase